MTTYVTSYTGLEREAMLSLARNYPGKWVQINTDPVSCSAAAHLVLGGFINVERQGRDLFIRAREEVHEQ